MRNSPKLIIVMVMLVAFQWFNIEQLNAQDYAFQQGRVSLHGGYGFGNVIQALVFTDLGGEFGFHNNNLGPFHGKVEYAVNDNIGVGLSVNYVRAGASFQNDVVSDYYYDVGYENTSVLLRTNIHFVKHEQLDAYVGLGLGYRTGRYWIDTNDPDGYNWVQSGNAINPVGIEMVAGVRYYFIPNLGIYLETGMAKSAVQLGLSGNF